MMPHFARVLSSTPIPPSTLWIRLGRFCEVLFISSSPPPNSELGLFLLPTFLRPLGIERRLTFLRFRWPRPSFVPTLSRAHRASATGGGCSFFRVGDFSDRSDFFFTLIILPRGLAASCRTVRPDPLKDIRFRFLFSRTF